MKAVGAIGRKMIDIGGAKPVEADRIAEVYSAGHVTLYNPRSGKTVDRSLKGMEPWELVEALGGTEVFATHRLNWEYDAVVWMRRSMIRNVVRGVDPSGKHVEPWSYVQMIYHPELPDPYPVGTECGLWWSAITPLTVAETWDSLNARGPVIRPTRRVKPPRPVLDVERLSHALEGKKALAGVSDQVLAVARPQAHLVHTPDPEAVVAYLVDVEEQKGQKLLAVVDLARLDPALGLPESGSLSFHHDGRSSTWGDKATHAKRFSVSYSESSAGLIVEGTSGLVPMTATTGVGLPPIDSTDGEAIEFQTEKQEDAYVDLLAKLYGEPRFPGGVPGTWIGGYPYQLQDDMQEQCAEMAQKAWGIESEPEEWRLLLQLASESDASMSWGEDGFLYYWIRESDLAARDFSHVWCILQTM